MRVHSIFWTSTVLVAATQLAGCAEGFGARADSTAGVTETAQGGVPNGTVVLSGTCNAAAGSYAVGRAATPALQSELITKTLAKTLRVIRPGEAVTKEFSSQRLNLDLDGAGTITAVRCG